MSVNSYNYLAQAGRYTFLLNVIENYCHNYTIIRPILFSNMPMKWNMEFAAEKPTTATEVANFVAALGDNCGAPIMAPEPFNMDQTFINTYLSNTTAKANQNILHSQPGYRRICNGLQERLPNSDHCH
jgi:hypothetical protein